MCMVVIFNSAGHGSKLSLVAFILAVNNYTHLTTKATKKQKKLQYGKLMLAKTWSLKQAGVMM